MITVEIVGICAIVSICFCLIVIGISLDRIRDILERIAQNITKGGTEMKTTFDRQVVTGHIDDTEMYEDIKRGKRKWRDYMYSKITHIKVPKEVFERLLELDRKGGK